GKPIYNRFTQVNHYKGVPPPMNGNYMLTFTSPNTDESPRPYGKQTSESTEIKSTSKNSNFSFDFSDRSSVPTASNSCVESARPNNVVNDFKDFTSRTSTNCNFHKHNGKGILGNGPSENHVNTFYQRSFPIPADKSFGSRAYTPYYPKSKHFPTSYNSYYSMHLANGTFEGTVVKPSADIAKDTGIADSECSRSMSGNRDTLDDFVDFDGGPVRFGYGFVPADTMTRVTWNSFLLIELVATIDGHEHTISKATIRTTLHLDNLDAADVLPNQEIFDGLQAIGYITITGIIFSVHHYNWFWKVPSHLTWGQTCVPTLKLGGQAGDNTDKQGSSSPPMFTSQAQILPPWKQAEKIYLLGSNIPLPRASSYALLTRPPLETPLPVRLACVKHAASIHPELRSNSP
nr:ribonuclease H-like domain, reverse transcriptase, RNA-dependent DNA polymerase [Tanacetum cinerariifolium]